MEYSTTAVYPSTCVGDDGSAICLFCRIAGAGQHMSADGTARVVQMIAAAIGGLAVADYFTMRNQQQENDADLDALRVVKEVRLAKIEGKLPFDVRILFIIPESGLSDNGIALDRFVARMRRWFNPLAARLVAWDARHIYEITVGDYLDTQQIYLDHYSYRGQTIQGLLPSPRL